MKNTFFSKVVAALIAVITLVSISGVTPVAEAATTGVTYRTHVQNYGWQDWKYNGDSAGTTGESKRLEGINIKLSGIDGGITYRTHVQSYGWQGWKSNGEMSGTSGESKRLEAIQIKLTGAAADTYDVYYRVHAQHFGWLSWAKNGEVSGTAGYAYRLESIQIKLVKKGESAPGSTTTPYHVAHVRYQTHVQNVGWQGLVGEGITSGTSGKSLRLEGIKIQLANKEYSGGITYRTHVQNIGWQDWVSDGNMSGTSGKSLRLEAIQIKLTGEIANHYDLYYRVHAQDYGWLGWAKNGEESGTAGYSKRLEAIQIVLVEKGGSVPGNVDGIVSKNANSYVSKISNSDCSVVVRYTWMVNIEDYDHEYKMTNEKSVNISSSDDTKKAALKAVREDMEAYADSISTKTRNYYLFDGPFIDKSSYSSENGKEVWTIECSGWLLSSFNTPTHLKEYDRYDRIYYLNDYDKNYLTLADGYNGSYQIDLTGCGMKNPVIYNGNSCVDITDSGYVTATGKCGRSFDEDRAYTGDDDYALIWDCMELEGDPEQQEYKLNTNDPLETIEEWAEVTSVLGDADIIVYDEDTWSYFIVGLRVFDYGLLKAHEIWEDFYNGCDLSKAADPLDALHIASLYCQNNITYYSDFYLLYRLGVTKDHDFTMYEHAYYLTGQCETYASSTLEILERNGYGENLSYIEIYHRGSTGGYNHFMAMMQYNGEVYFADYGTVFKLNDGVIDKFTKCEWDDGITYGLKVDEDEYSDWLSDNAKVVIHAQ